MIELRWRVVWIVTRSAPGTSRNAYPRKDQPLATLDTMVEFSERIG